MKTLIILLLTTLSVLSHADNRMFYGASQIFGLGFRYDYSILEHSDNHETFLSAGLGFWGLHAGARTQYCLSTRSACAFITADYANVPYMGGDSIGIVEAYLFGLGGLYYYNSTTAIELTVYNNH